jgi:hypothetical protein
MIVTTLGGCLLAMAIMARQVLAVYLGMIGILGIAGLTW